MNLEFFFIILAHLFMFTTFLVILPVFKTSKNSKFKAYRR